MAQLDIIQTYELNEEGTETIVHRTRSDAQEGVIFYSASDDANKALKKKKDYEKIHKPKATAETESDELTESFFLDSDG